MTQSSRLCIFARTPVRGAVKQRLAAGIGETAALRAHERLVEDTLRRLARVPGVTSELWIAGQINEASSCWAEQAGVTLRQQQGEGLGARMQHALAHSLGSADSALIVGSDCPAIDEAYVVDA